MSKKRIYKGIRYIDFVLIDLLCLIISFFVAYYLKFNEFVDFDDERWSSLFIIMCAINLIVMFCVNPYKGIKKRRYLLQIKKEMVLVSSQVALVCIIFYVLIEAFTLKKLECSKQARAAWIPQLGIME